MEAPMNPEFAEQRDEDINLPFMYFLVFISLSTRDQTIPRFTAIVKSVIMLDNKQHVFSSVLKTEVMAEY
jgi:hypothetical protein